MTWWWPTGRHLTSGLWSHATWCSTFAHFQRPPQCCLQIRGDRGEARAHTDVVPRACRAWSLCCVSVHCCSRPPAPSLPAFTHLSELMGVTAFLCSALTRRCFLISLQSGPGVSVHIHCQTIDYILFTNRYQHSVHCLGCSKHSTRVFLNYLLTNGTGLCSY